MGPDGGGLGVSVGPIPLKWLAAAGLYGVSGGAAVLLAWVTIKPLARRSPAWLPKPPVQLDWVEALRPRALCRIGVALEHDRADAEILNRAGPGPDPTEPQRDRPAPRG